MKRFLFFTLIMIGLGAVSAGQEFNGPNAEKRTVEAFHGIQVGTGIELVITEGDREEVAVSAITVEHRDKIITRVEKGILKIYYENKVNAPNTKRLNKEMKAWVSYKKLDQLVANTGAELKINGVLKTGSLKIEANTGARLSGAVNASSLEIDQNTGSKMTLTGEAGNLKIEGSTGSKFDGEDLRVSTCDVRVSTGAQVTITANKELVARASTGGNVKYKGDAGVKELKKSTGGTIKKI